MTNYKLNIADALASLHPEGWIVRGGVYSGLEWDDDVSEKDRPTEAEINAELKRLQAEYDSKQYQRDRLAEYPSIQELVVALYDEEDKQAIIEKRNAVKAKYPKPE
jgi:hypothetical protein|tara:strand:- start:132 stop:449 length:318 start_codon:yes stop_codon:yes gene_type:complete